MPTFPVTVLKARVPLTKTFRQQSKEPYPNVRDFKSSIEQVSSLEDLLRVTKKAALEGACLLKGELDQILDWEPRRGHHLTDKPTYWVCFDIDHMPSMKTVDDFLVKIGVTDVSYILQYSASYMIHGNPEIRCHLFMMLDQPCSPQVLKLWLKQLNLQLFLTDLTLDSTGNVIKWALDIGTCQADKLLFVTPPTCYPSSLNEWHGDRITLVRKAKDCLTLPSGRLTVAQIKTLEQTKIDEMRVAAGLPKKKREFKDYKGQQYLSKPDTATIQGAKVDGDFVRFNLNDGDSYAYYHPVGNPEIIYNFKGEPNYKTQELDPDYYYSVINAGKQAVTSRHKGKMFLGFRDFKTSLYYNGFYDQDNDVIEVAQAKTAGDVMAYLADMGQPIPDHLPTWDVIFNPMAPPIDITNRQVNFFQLSPIMKQAATRESHQPFPRIDALMRYVIGPSCIDHWYNWIAYVYQKRIAPGTAWVWHGTQGTGKGLIFNVILRALFGNSNVTSRRMEELNEKFNAHLDKCLLCFIDEAQVSKSGKSEVIMANLKNQITEPMITIRRMNVNAYEVVNYTGWIFASNMPDAVVITGNDRRFNVAEYQPNPWPQPTADDVAALEAEILDFAVFLKNYAVDEIKAREVMKNEDRAQMILISQPSADTLAQHIKAGSLSDLWDALPIGEFKSTDNRLQDAHFHYKALMYDLVKTGRNKLTRDELYVLFNYCVGNVPSQPSKFASYLKHHGIAVTPTRNGNTVFKGFTVKWNDMPEWFDERRAEIAQIEAPQLKVVK